MKPNLITLCFIVTIFSTPKIYSQDVKESEIHLKLKDNQIENLMGIELVYSNDICLGCPMDSCKYCPVFSIHQSELGRSVHVRVALSKDSTYHLILIDTEGVKRNVNAQISFEEKRTNVINLRKIRTR